MRAKKQKKLTLKIGHYPVCRNVALRCDFEASPDSILVSGRGQMHLTVLIENMRREGYEFEIGPPEVITKQENGTKYEPWDKLEIAVADEYVGSICGEMEVR